MFGVVWDYYSLKLKGKQYIQSTTPKSYEIEIKIIANPGLALSGFEQSGLGGDFICAVFGLVIWRLRRKMFVLLFPNSIGFW